MKHAQLAQPVVIIGHTYAGGISSCTRYQRAVFLKEPGTRFVCVFALMIRVYIKFEDEIPSVTFKLGCLSSLR